MLGSGGLGKVEGTRGQLQYLDSKMNRSSTTCKINGVTAAAIRTVVRTIAARVFLHVTLKNRPPPQEEYRRATNGTTLLRLAKAGLSKDMMGMLASKRLAGALTWEAAAPTL